MAKNLNEKKLIEQAMKMTENDSKELDFIEYQESVKRSKEAKRNRLVLISLTSAVYLLGLGIFSTIVETIYNINHIAGIVVLAVLFVLYTVFYIVMIVSIFSKHSFDLEFRKRKTGYFPERNNNKVRWEIARNIQEQDAVLDYLEKKKNKEYLTKKENESVSSFMTLISLSSEYDGSVPSYRSEDSKLLASCLSSVMEKDGVLYKKAQGMIMKKAIATGCLTALSPNAVMDMSIVAIKNIQLIKDLVWLYGFRPSDYEMNRILFRVIRNLAVSVGLNTMQSTTNLLASALKKSSDNIFVQLLSNTIQAGAQFLGNGAMTYLVGKYTVKVLLNEYHLQDLFHLSSVEDFEIGMNEDTLKTINASIESEVREITPEEEKKQIKDETLKLPSTKRKIFSFFPFCKKEKEKEEIKKNGTL